MKSKVLGFFLIIVGCVVFSSQVYAASQASTGTLSKIELIGQAGTTGVTNEVKTDDLLTVEQDGTMIYVVINEEIGNLNLEILDPSQEVISEEVNCIPAGSEFVIDLSSCQEGLCQINLSNTDGIDLTGFFILENR